MGTGGGMFWMGQWILNSVRSWKFPYWLRTTNFSTRTPLHAFRYLTIFLTLFLTICLLHFNVLYITIVRIFFENTQMSVMRSLTVIHVPLNRICTCPKELEDTEPNLTITPLRVNARHHREHCCHLIFGRCWWRAPVTWGYTASELRLQTALNIALE